MKHVAFFLLSALSFQCFSQMLTNAHALIFEGRPEFNTSFIRTQHIKSFSADYFTKAELDEIRENNEFSYYKFNKSGELVFDYRTFLGDTLYTLYVWDGHGNLSIKRVADKYSFRSYHYRYDSYNRLIYSEVRSVDNHGQDHLTYVPEENYTVSSETFTYTDLEGKDYKKHYLNSSGTVYKEEFFHFDDTGRLVEQTGYMKSGSGNTSVKFIYDDRGALITKTTESSVMGNFSSKYEYFYDSKNNILSMKYYENDVYKTEFQYVYDAEDLLLKAIIMLDVETHVMTIVKYEEYLYH